MAKITPEIVTAALEADEAFQYANLVNLMKAGKVLSTSQQRKYDRYKAKIEGYMAAGPGPPEDEGVIPDPEERVGIPESLRVKRRYTMTEAALEQRRAAGKSPAHAASMQGNRNGWKTGQHVQNFINKIKPCKSTCPQYPCELVEEGRTEPGGDCLDKADVLSFFRAVQDAIAKREMTSFNDLAALQISNTMKVVDMLQEDVIRDGTLMKREKYDAHGNLVIEYVTHPSLLALPKLVADLGLNPADFLITPRAKARATEDDDEGRGLVDAISRGARALSKLASRKGGAADDEE